MTEQNRRDLLLLINVAEKAQVPGNSPVDLTNDLRSIESDALIDLRKKIEDIKTD